MAATLSVIRLLTNKADLADSRIETFTEPAAVQAGEIIVRVDRFALTTNNITYAAFGDSMDYWKFFPTGTGGWGHMPVWGFAEVLASGVDGIAVGERFYGYFPMRSHFRMRPDRVSDRGFYDGQEHRLGLVSAYNQYTRCSTDSGYVPALEDYQMLLRPLFLTSWMLADFLTDNDLFGAERVLVSSASSKTAYGTAFCLEGRSLIGLTSGRNRAFVESLGCYDRAVAYDELSSVGADKATLYVDFSGDEALREAVHRHFGASLVYDCFAGSAANTDPFDPAVLPGPVPQFFFAPVQIKKRNVDWGPAVVTRRYNESQSAFLTRVSRPEAPWIILKEGHSLNDAAEVIRTLVQSGGAPADGQVIHLP